MCLGQVIMALVDVSNGKTRHICYRDSKLTFLLRVSDFFFSFYFFVQSKDVVAHICTLTIF